MKNYPDHLEAMWQKAIAPRADNAPTVISTFAGGGGSLTGYAMAGYRDLLAVEWDDNAVQTLRLNYPELDIYHGDIAKLSVDEVLRRTGLEVGQLDVLDGSPPCQGFSTAGKRMIDDPRNQLFREYVRLLRGLRPKVFVMENVSGMVKGKMKLVFVEILKELKASGYKVSARLLNAKYFHVPQSRERMIFIGVRDDLGIEPSHPKAESEGVTVRQAWQNLVVNKEKLGLTPLYSAYWNQAKAGESMGKLKTTKKLSFDKPSFTIVKSEGNGGLYHPSECRMLHHYEFKRIASYPDGFMFAGVRKDWQERIGNSVPPLFMEAIARHIRTAILSHTPPVG
jgi:DNA (cytosine-5)-methyltransferase 1